MKRVLHWSYLILFFLVFGVSSIFSHRTQVYAAVACDLGSTTCSGSVLRTCTASGWASSTCTCPCTDAYSCGSKYCTYACLSEGGYCTPDCNGGDGDTSKWCDYQCSCTASCWGGSGYNKYCSTSCTAGCSSLSCSGGTCNPTPTPTTSSCEKVALQWCSDYKGTCYYDNGCPGTGSCTGGFACCKPCPPTNTPTRTPTPTTGSCVAKGGFCEQNSDCCGGTCNHVTWECGSGCYINGSPCSSNSDCCSGNCVAGSCRLAATSTPTKTPTPTISCGSITGQQCIYASCSSASMDTGTGGCSYPLTCCKAKPACGDHTEACCSTSPACKTNTTSTTSDDLYCINNQCVYALGGDIKKCVPSVPLAEIQTCSVYNTAASTCTTWIHSSWCPSGYKCADDGINCTQITYTGQYCLSSCNDSKCTAQTINKDQTKCWTDYTAYYNDVVLGLNGSGEHPNSWSGCINITNCIDNSCIARWDTCGGELTEARCDQLYPGKGYVGHIDSCGGLSCGSPCANPTPTGGGGCTPDCSGADNVCRGSTFTSTNDCGICYGQKSCTGTITVKAVYVSAADKSCSALAASTNYANGTTFSFSPALVPSSQTQTDGTGVSWSAATTGSTNYALTAVPPATYVQANICVTNNGGASYTQNSAATLPDGGTLGFIVGYIPQVGWVQTVGGNAYAGTKIVASVPTTANNAYFSLAGAMGDAGMVSYGQSYDFSLSSSDLGENMVSSKGWLVPSTNTAIDYYTQFASRMDVAGNATAIDTLTDVTKPTCSSSPCMFYASGDLTTATGNAWTIGANEKMILFVNGNVTINSPITITSGGFFALIAHGNIIINNSVGGSVGSTAPVLEGIYIASNAAHNAVFTTGDSSTSGAEKLIVKGSVVADDFLLERDLGATYNDTTPAEQFIFNPQLLFTMPDTMKEIPYIWQEVAP